MSLEHSQRCDPSAPQRPRGQSSRLETNQESSVIKYHVSDPSLPISKSKGELAKRVGRRVEFEVWRGRIKKPQLEAPFTAFEVTKVSSSRTATRRQTHGFWMLHRSPATNQER